MPMRQSELLKLALLEAERLGDKTLADIETIAVYETIAKAAFALFILGFVALMAWALLG